jgi:GntR family transcriptional regulator
MPKSLKDNALPLYLQLKNIITTQIKNGTFQPGEKLPSERELCERYKVSRITVRQALGALDNEGYILRSHGKGTFVAYGKVEQELFSITPFQNSILSKGLNPTTKYLEANIIANTYQLSKTLNVPLSESLIELTLLGLGDNLPMALYTSYFATDLGMKMQELATKAVDDNIPFTTLDLYKYLPQISPGTISQTFEASIADAYIAKILNIKKGNPILIAESIIYSADDLPLEYKTTIYRGDKYKFSIVRKPGS